MQTQNQTKVIQRGAEAVLYLQDFEGETVLVKERIKKGYRLAELDKKIRHQRTERESSFLSSAKRLGVSVPRVLEIEECKITMEFIDGKRIKDTLNTMSENERLHIYALIGKAVAMLHSGSIIHEDLTTSNMILRNKDIFIIDFGLGKKSGRVEDMATDLYLLYEALKAAHFKYLEEAWENILNTYKHNYSNSIEVLAQFDKISKRRRYK